MYLIIALVAICAIIWLVGQILDLTIFKPKPKNNAYKVWHQGTYNMHIDPCKSWKRYIGQ